MERMKYVSLVAAALLVLSGCTSGTKESIGFARQPEFKAQTKRKSRGGKEAAPEIPRILPETHYAAGRVFEQQGSPEKAIEQYRKAVAVNHNYTAAYSRLGLMLSITGQHEDAVAVFQRALELKPESAILHNNLGFEFLYLERWVESERHLREATRLDPKLAHANINLGLLLGRTQRNDEALASFRQALPEADAYYNVGLIHRAQGRLEMAAESFRTALTIEPRFIAAQRQLNVIENRLAAIQTRQETQKVQPVYAATTQPAGTMAVADAATPGPAPLDLNALIDELFPRSTPANHTASAHTIPALTPNQPGPATLEPTLTIPEAATTKPIEYFEEEDDVKETKPTAAVTPADSRPSIRPVHWPLSLPQVALALNQAATPQQAMEEVKVHTMQPGPVPPGVEELVFGPPAPGADETVLVLEATETRPQEFTSKVIPAQPRSAVREETWKLVRDTEVSLQILRNEIECQKSEAIEGQSGEATPRQVDPDRRTDRWNLEFDSVERLLTSVRSRAAHALAQGQKNPNGQGLAQPEAYPPGPAYYTPTPTTPRRKWHRSPDDSGSPTDIRP